MCRWSAGDRETSEGEREGEEEGRTMGKDEGEERQGEGEEEREAEGVIVVRAGMELVGPCVIYRYQWMLFTD